MQLKRATLFDILDPPLKYIAKRYTAKDYEKFYHVTQSIGVLFHNNNIKVYHCFLLMAVKINKNVGEVSVCWFLPSYEVISYNH